MQVIAPFPGHIWEVSCGTGDAVNVGDQLFVIEAMKMETPVLAAITGAHLAKGPCIKLLL